MSALRTTLTALALLAGSLATARAAPPNVLLIVADDQRFDTIHALGNAEIRTPHLDKLVDRGFVFTNTYCQGGLAQAVCAPSRAMLMTGQSVFRAPGPAEPPTGPTLGKVMDDAGYDTLYAGKKYNAYTAGNEAFRHCVYIDGGIIESDKQDEQGTAAQQPRLMVDAAISFLNKDHAGKPLFMMLAPHSPHDPRVAPKAFHDLYDPARISLSPNFVPQHPFDNGDMLVRDELLAKLPRDPDEMKRHLADYYASISWLDDQVGRLLDDLKQRGQLDNTVVIYTSDQGLAVGGRHGLMGKQNLYEEFKSPLIIAGPGVPKGKSDALVYLFDLFPTLCEIASVRPPAGCEGVSLLPVIRGQAAATRDLLFAPYRDVQRMVRDDRWKLIWYPKIDRFQLFDLRQDPWEMHDLSADPASADRLTAMKTHLAAEQKKWGDPQPRPK